MTGPNGQVTALGRDGVLWTVKHDGILERFVTKVSARRRFGELSGLAGSAERRERKAS